MTSYDIDASVDPAIRKVTEGEDATFSCQVSGSDAGNVSIVYNWVADQTVLREGRFKTTDAGQGFRILRTTGVENNTDVTCSVRSSETKQLISSGKSRLVVMPVEKVQPITSPHHLTEDKSTTKHTPTAKITTLSGHTQTPTEGVGRTSQTGLGGLNIAILSGVIVGAVALLLVLLFMMIIYCRYKKRKELEQRASFSGRHNKNADGVPQMKRYEFLDPESGQKMAFSETDGFAPSPRKQSNKTNQEMLRTYSRGSAPDLLASCGLEDKSSLKKAASKKGYCSNDSLAQHFYESVTPFYIVPEHRAIDNHSYTDIIIGDQDDDINDNDTTKLEETNNMKNSTNGPPLDRFGYVELNIEPQNLSISSEDLDETADQTDLSPCLPNIHENSRTAETDC